MFKILTELQAICHNHYLHTFMGVEKYKYNIKSVLIIIILGLS